MTKLSAFVYTLFYFGLTSLGVFIAYAVNWTNSGAKYFGILAFFLVGFGSLFLSVALTRLMIPCKYNFDLSTLSNPLNYKELKNKIGKKIHFINVTYISLFFILFAISAFSYVKFVDTHIKNQLLNYGQTQKVRITKIDYLGKGTPYAFFDFYYGGKKYSDRLSQRDFNPGDSAFIIFSTKNPVIIEWAGDFEWKINHDTEYE